MIHIFELRRRGTCWAHASRNIDKKLALVKNKDKRKEIRNDIWELQLSHNSNIFNAGLKLFLDKYKADTACFEFLRTFEANQCSDLSIGWYEVVNFLIL